MKILMVVESKSCGNTRKIVDKMASVTDMTIVDTKTAVNTDFKKYDIVGFGSGIYMGKHDKRILDLANSLDDESLYTFVVSTSGGSDFDDNNKALTDILVSKNKTVLGTFSCKARDRFFVLKLVGGINKNLPAQSDYKNAERFIKDITQKYTSLTEKTSE